MTLREEIAKIVAKQLKEEYPSITKEQVDDLAKIQFEFITEVMESGDYQSIRIPFLGLFHANPNRIIKLYSKGYKFKEEVVNKAIEDKAKKYKK